MISVIEQLTAVHEKSVEEVMGMLCRYLPNTLRPWCLDLINDYGDIIIELLGLLFFHISFQIVSSCVCFVNPKNLSSTCYLS